MKLYEAIFYGLMTYAGAAGFMWFLMKAIQTAPRDDPGQRSMWGPKLSNLSDLGRMSVVCGALSLLIMVGGLMLLYGVAVSIPPQHGPYAVTHQVTAFRVDRESPPSLTFPAS
jgi:hypothetical protein